MSLQLGLFGGGQTAAGKLPATNDGNHAIDKSKVLAQTDAGVITPNTPGNFSSIRSAPVVPDPRYFDREQADKLKELAHEKTDGARQSKRAYKALTKIEVADKTVHKEHRKYEGAVAANELGKKCADAGLGRVFKLQPQQNAGERNHGCIICGQLLISSCDTAKLFESVDRTFNNVTLTVDFTTKRTSTGFI